MSSLNKVILVGRLGQDPELRFTQNQKAVCNLSLATSERSVDANGQKQEQTEWHRVVVWGKSAENANRFLKKGSSVLVEGKITTRSFEVDGQKRNVTEIVGYNLQFLSTQQNSGNNFIKKDTAEKPAFSAFDDIPF